MKADLGLEAELAVARRWRDTVESDPAGRPRLAAVDRGELEALVRRQFHRSLTDDLRFRRTRRAVEELVLGQGSVGDVLERTGFRSTKALSRATRELVGMEVEALGQAGGAKSFVVKLPRDYRLETTFATWGRDPEKRLEWVEGSKAAKAIFLGGKPAILEFDRRGRDVRVRLVGIARPGKARVLESIWVAVRALGLSPRPRAFESRAAKEPLVARLVEGRCGLRIPQTASAFEGLVWVIVGQQVNVTFAATCRARLAELVGTEVSGMVAHPRSSAVAELEVPDLLPLQFSRRKAEYVIDTARAIVSGELDLEGLAQAPVGEIERTLLAVRGLGRWSVNYLMMRSFGLADCVPAGDSALALALERFFQLASRPSPDETVRWMETFAPHRSLATVHLWRSYA